MCDAGMRFLEWRRGETRADLRRPAVPGDGRPVAFRFTLGKQGVAIEGTLIEAFEGQVAADRRMHESLGPVKATLDGTLPGDAVYEPVQPLDTRLDREFVEFAQARSDLIAWARETAGQLRARAGEDDAAAPRACAGHCRIVGTPPGSPYPVTPYRRARPHPGGGAPGAFYVSRAAPESEALRAEGEERLRRAPEKKGPKPERCKECCTRTVLVLENGDSALSSPSGVFGGLLPALDARDDTPPDHRRLGN